MQEEKSKVHGDCGTDLVFRAKRGGPIRESTFRATLFQAALERRRIAEIWLYDLRHTAATSSFAAGVPPKIISEQLGHSTVAFTLDVYSHMLPHMQDAAAERVQALLFGAGVPPKPEMVNASFGGESLSRWNPQVGCPK